MGARAQAGWSVVAHPSQRSGHGLAVGTVVRATGESAGDGAALRLLHVGRAREQHFQPAPNLAPPFPQPQGPLVAAAPADAGHQPDLCAKLLRLTSLWPVVSVVR